MTDLAHLRRAVFLGIVSSAAGGAGDLAASARAGVLQWLDTASSLTAYEFPIILIDEFEKDWRNDRVALPTMDVLAFGFDQGLFIIDEPGAARLMTVLEQVVKTTNIKRLEGVIQLDSALASQSMIATKFLFALSKMLLHNYPIVRPAL